MIEFLLLVMKTYCEHHYGLPEITKIGTLKAGVQFLKKKKKREEKERYITKTNLNHSLFTVRP